MCYISECPKIILLTLGELETTNNVYNTNIEMFLLPLDSALLSTVFRYLDELQLFLVRLKFLTS